MTERLLPDFADALERRLRDEAAGSRGARRWALRLAVPALACGALALLVLAVRASDERRLPAAYGRPAILRAPLLRADAIIRRLNRGASARMTFGPGARLTAARGIPAFGGTAYVVTGPSGWCLAAPDPGASPADNPGGVGAVTCRRTAEVYAYGIALGIGRNVVAALPAGARAPTLTTPAGTKTLTLDERGLVVVERTPPHAVLALYGTDGSARRLRLP